MTKHYFYPSGVVSTPNVETVEIRTDGSHTLVCFDNQRHLMAAGFSDYADGDVPPAEWFSPAVLSLVEAPPFEEVHFFEPAVPAVEPVVEPVVLPVSEEIS